MPATASGADVLANTLLTSLLDGKTFAVPDVDLTGLLFAQPDGTSDLYTAITELTAEDLTTGIVGGTGMFDKLMASLTAHLKVEFEQNRISGAEYTKAYIGVVGAAMQTSAQYLLGKDQAYWQALLVQQQAQMTEVEVTRARIQLETARVELSKAQFEASTAEAAYGLTKIQISVQDITYTNHTKQGLLIDEQKEAARGQTMDLRSDGLTTIEGAIGKQKDLYDQQIVSYQRDAETKLVKIYSDAWITQKTIDEGLTAPTEFTNVEIDAVLGGLRTNLAL